MSSILIVEDDENKYVQLKELVKEEIQSCVVTIAKSYHTGLRIIQEGKNDLILLDMTMPTYEINQNEDGGRLRHYAGRDILQQMERRHIITPVIVVTQFDVFGEGIEALTRAELDKQLRAEHPVIYKGMVYFNAAHEGWMSELRKTICDCIAED